MRPNISFALQVLRGLELLPLEEVTEHAAAWRRDLDRAITELEREFKETRSFLQMSDDDPLMFDKSGGRLSEAQLQKKLAFIINCWPGIRK